MYEAETALDRHCAAYLGPEHLSRREMPRDDSHENANCFVSAFEAKNIMIEEEANEYSNITYAHPILFCGMPTVEATAKALASLDEDSALGPYLVPTRILKRCAKVLAPILHVLILAIVKFGEWQTTWREH